MQWTDSLVDSTVKCCVDEFCDTKDFFFESRENEANPVLTDEDFHSMSDAFDLLET